MKKKQKKKDQCYMCSDISTSREHVPPLCLFPEEKDIKTALFRKDLITVPSCDLHNSKKSKDDEFLMASLAGIVGNKVIGFFHNQTKVRRALERKGMDSINSLMKDLRDVDLKSKGGHTFPILIGRPDFNRLHSCFQHIAYGIYHHKFGKRFEGECRIILDFLSYSDETAEKYKILCRKRIELEPNKPKKEGTNPEIFKYEFIEPDEHGLIALQMTFYEGAKVFVAYLPKDLKMPYNLVTELINAGVKTIINLDDDNVIEFN